jgi:hypothetical protein
MTPRNKVSSLIMVCDARLMTKCFCKNQHHEYDRKHPFCVTSRHIPCSVYKYNPFQVKAIGSTWPKLQIRQGSTLEELGLTIFHNFVSSTTTARGAQLGIILNFTSSTMSARGAHPRHHRQLRYHHVPHHQLRQHLHVSRHQLRRHYLLQLWFNLNHLDYFDDIIYFRCDSNSTTSTTSNTTRVRSQTIAKWGWGCTGGLVHHHCPMLMRESLKML